MKVFLIFILKSQYEHDRGTMEGDGEEEKEEEKSRRERKRIERRDFILTAGAFETNKYFVAE